MPRETNLFWSVSCLCGGPGVYLWITWSSVERWILDHSSFETSHSRDKQQSRESHCQPMIICFPIEVTGMVHQDLLTLYRGRRNTSELCEGDIPSLNAYSSSGVANSEAPERSVLDDRYFGSCKYPNAWFMEWNDIYVIYNTRRITVKYKQKPYNYDCCSA